MPNTKPEQSIAQGRLLLSADNNVDVGENFKLSAWLRAKVDGDVTDLETKNQAVDAEEGARRAASGLLQTAYADGTGLIRSVNKYLDSLPKSIDKAAVKAHYGLSGKLQGNLQKAVVEGHLRDFLAASPNASPDDAKLRQSTLDSITQTLATIDANKAAAHGGSRGDAVNARNLAFVALEDDLSRSWHFLCATLPNGVFDVRLNGYGFTPRQMPTPGKPGKVAQLIVSPLPDNALRFVWSAATGATSYKLFRKVTGQDVDFLMLRDGLTGATLDLTDEPAGVELQYAIAGHNSQGDGPLSDAATITLPA